MTRKEPTSRPAESAVSGTAVLPSSWIVPLLTGMVVVRAHGDRGASHRGHVAAFFDSLDRQPGVGREAQVERELSTAGQVRRW